jgi:glycosyltransferase involved in cell wall biosynthesis
MPCESTKVDAMRYYGLPEGNLHTVEQGADPAFQPCRDAEVSRARRRRLLGRDVPYVLIVGKLSQRRNIPALIEAFARVKLRRSLPHTLLLLGPNHTNLPLDKLALDHGVAGSVIQLDGDFCRSQ